MAEDNEELLRRLEESEKANEKLARANERLARSQGSATSANQSFVKQMTMSKDSVDAFGSALTMSDTNLKKMATTFATSLDPKTILDKTAQIEFLTSNLARQSLGASRIAGDEFTQTLVTATEESLKYGVSIEDNLEMMKSINDVMQVNTYLTNEQVTDMGILARNAGVSSGEIASIAKGFADIGVGTNDAIDNISQMQKQARDYGINVGQFMKTVGSNMKLLSTYNFKNGIEGFSKMLAKAQALRIDVSSTFALSEKLLDPEQAIETAAGFQMLGGAIGDLGDPFKLLNMAQTDVAGLQDAMLGMAESAVIFDEETGEFDIPVAEMYRLREAAKLAGKSYEEFTQDAIKAKQRTEKLEILDSFGRYDDKTKELISSLAQFDGGELKVKLPGYEEALDVASLGQDEIEELRKLQEENAMDDKAIALRSMKALEAMAFGAKQAAMTSVKLGANTKGVTDALELMEATAKASNNVLGDSFSADNLKPVGDKLTAAIEKGLADPTLNADYRKELEMLLEKTNKKTGEEFENLPEYMSEGNILKTPGLLGSLTTNLSSMGMTADEVSTFVKQLTEDLKGLSVDYTLPNSDDFTLVPTNKSNSSSDTEDVNDFILRPGMDPIKFNENDLLIGGTNLLGDEQLGLNTPDLGMSMIQGLQDFSNRDNREVSNSTQTSGKLEIEFKQGLPITLDGNVINQLSPEDLRMIFGSQEFITALKENLSKNTRYDEPIMGV